MPKNTANQDGSAIKETPKNTNYFASETLKNEALECVAESEKNDLAAAEKFDAFLRSLSTGNFHLSFSKIKAFRKSPYHFYQYVTATDKQTDAMKFGQIDHVLILEGEAAFTKVYEVLDRPTDLRCNDSKNGCIGKIEFAQLVQKAAVNGKQLVKRQDMEKAIHIRKMLMQDPFCRDLLLREGQSELPFKFDFAVDSFFEYPIRGRIDKAGQGYKLDLKNISGFCGKNLERYILGESLHIQAAIYQMAFGWYDDYYLLCCDTNAVLPVRLSQKMIDKGKHDLEETLLKFEICHLDRRWLESVGFWHENGLCVV